MDNRFRLQNIDREFAHLTFRVVAIRHDLSRDAVGKGLTIRKAVAVGQELITDNSVLNYEIEEEIPAQPGIN